MQSNRDDCSTLPSPLLATSPRLSLSFSFPLSLSFTFSFSHSSHRSWKLPLTDRGLDSQEEKKEEEGEQEEKENAGCSKPEGKYTGHWVESRCFVAYRTSTNRSNILRLVLQRIDKYCFCAWKASFHSSFSTSHSP